MITKKITKDSVIILLQYNNKKAKKSTKKFQWRSKKITFGIEEILDFCYVDLIMLCYGTEEKKTCKCWRYRTLLLVVVYYSITNQILRMLALTQKEINYTEEFDDRNISHTWAMRYPEMMLRKQNGCASRHGHYLKRVDWALIGVCRPWLKPLWEW